MSQTTFLYLITSEKACFSEGLKNWSFIILWMGYPYEPTGQFCSDPVFIGMINSGPHNIDIHHKFSQSSTGWKF